MPRTVERALKALLIIMEEPMTCSKVAEELGIDRSSASRLLQTLVAYRFLKKEGMQYKVGLAALSLARSYLNLSELRSRYQDLLCEMHEFSKETVYIAEFTGENLVCVGKIDGTFSLRISSQIGGTMPIWKGATGKAFLSALPDEKVRDLIQQLSVPVELDSLFHDLEEARRLGVAISQGELNKGVTGFSIPVIGYDGEPKGSFTLVGASARFDESRKWEIIDKLLAVRKQINMDWKEAVTV